VSVDSTGMLEYWTGPRHDYQFPPTVSWQYKTDTDLYEFAKVRNCYRYCNGTAMVELPVGPVFLRSVLTETSVSQCWCEKERPPMLCQCS